MWTWARLAFTASSCKPGQYLRQTLVTVMVAVALPSSPPTGKSADSPQPSGMASPTKRHLTPAHNPFPRPASNDEGMWRHEDLMPLTQLETTLKGHPGFRFCAEQTFRSFPRLLLLTSLLNPLPGKVGNAAKGRECHFHDSVVGDCNVGLAVRLCPLLTLMRQRTRSGFLPTANKEPLSSVLQLVRN